MQLYIDTANTKITVRNRCFYISNKTTDRIIAPKRISSVSVTGNITINASAIKLAANHEIPIYFFNHTGTLIANLTGPSYLKHSKLRLAQHSFFAARPGWQWSIETVLLKISLQIQTLKRLCKEKPSIKPEVNDILEAILALKTKIENMEPTSQMNNTLMALEGQVARNYYTALNIYLPSRYRFAKRSRRPGEDYFNATLNYIYGITYGHITKALHAAGLDTFTGGLHTTPYKETLVFDCIEPFRPIMDRLLLQLCNNQLLADIHFKAVSNGFWLSKEGKRLVLTAYADHLASRIKLNQKVLSIENHIYHFARNLKNTIIAQNR